MTKRALWLISNKVVTEADVPELIAHGYEVYTLKKTSWISRSDSLWTTDRYDSSLSISPSLKTALDAQLFMGDTPDELWEEINAHFDLAFIDYYAEQFEDWIDHFKGKTVCRLTRTPDAGSFGLQLAEDYGLQIFAKIDRMLSHFWFAPVFPHFADKEAQIIRRYAVDLPLILDIPERREAGTQESAKRVSVICPEIKVRSEQEMLYKNALKILEWDKNNKLPYVVCGKQYLFCDFDPNIVGDLPELQLMQLMRGSACALYLQPTWGRGDFSVFAAFRCGVPLLVPAKCDLAPLLTACHSPAVFGSVEQAHSLIKRLLDGDEKLRNSILKAQEAFFAAAFGRETNGGVYANGLEKIESTNIFATHKVEEKPRLAVILLDPYSDFTILQAKTVIGRLHASIGDRVSLCLGYPENGGYDEHLGAFRALEESGVPLRRYELASRDERWLTDMLTMKGYPVIEHKGDIFILDDHNTCFEDCRMLLLLPNRRFSGRNKAGSIISTRPYALYLPDFDEAKEKKVEIEELKEFIEEENGTAWKKKERKNKKEKNTEDKKEEKRKREEAEENENEEPALGESEIRIRLLREAQMVLLPDEGAREDAVYRFGAALGKTRVISPLYAELPGKADDFSIPDAKNYFLYFVDMSSGESLRRAQIALVDYYLRGGRKDVVLTTEDGKEGFRVWRFSRDSMDQMATRLPVFGKKQAEVKNPADTLKGRILTLEAFSSILRGAAFGILPQNSDLVSQVAYWLLREEIPLAMIDMSSTEQLTRQFPGRIFDLQDGRTERVCEALQKECRHAQEDGEHLPTKPALSLDQVFGRELGL